MPLAWRSNKGTSSRFSRSRIDRVMTDCARNKNSQAREMLPCSATRTKERMCIRAGSDNAGISITSKYELSCSSADHNEKSIPPSSERITSTEFRQSARTDFFNRIDQKVVVGKILRGISRVGALRYRVILHAESPPQRLVVDNHWSDN